MVELGARSQGNVARIAVVVDVRGRRFFANLKESLATLDAQNVKRRIVFLESSDEALVRRFESVRRPHPLQGDGRIVDGIAAERDLLRELRGDADLVIDTSSLNVHELRAKMDAQFAGEEVPELRATVMSFGFKYGLPVDADMVIDCRFIPNPHWVPELRPFTGLNDEVSSYVFSQPGSKEFLDGYAELLRIVAEGYRREGKRYVTIAVGCTGGKHRSVAMSEKLARRLVVRGSGNRRRPPGHGARVSARAPRLRRVRRFVPSGRMTKGATPKVVALGGGMGLSASLTALRRITGDLTAVVTVADDGGSSGRLRDELGVLPPGDLRKALAALCGDDDWGQTWSQVIQHRFQSEGELHDHAVGNLLIVALWEQLGDHVQALDLVGKLLGAHGRVLPMSAVPLELQAEVRGHDPDRPDAITHGPRPGHRRAHPRRGAVRSMLVPNDPPAVPEAVEAVLDADWVVLGPGSWFSSVIPHLLVPELREALDGDQGPKGPFAQPRAPTGRNRWLLPAASFGGFGPTRP